MKKTINFLAICAVLFISSCSDDDTLPVDFEDLQVSGAPFAQEITSGVVTNINKLDPTASSFSKQYSLVSPEGGSDVTLLEVFVGLDGENVQIPEVLLYTFNASEFDTNSGPFPIVTVDYLGTEIVSALNLNTDDLEGGDTFDFRLALTNSVGTFSDVSANFDNQSADHTFSSTVVCELPFFPPGDWTIEMADGFGDGWQTTTADGGPGITITLDDGTVFEVGLCTRYEDNDYECTANESSGTAIITIPENTISADWNFPGDNWGEISFTITSPSGNVVASVPEGTGTAGPIALNLCNE